MPACAPQPIVLCSATPAVNASQRLACLAAPLLLGRLQPAIGNRSAPGDGVSARELRAVRDGACSQMIGWGAATGFNRLLTTAERLAPGISLPWTAYQAYCALCDASRGDLLRCLQTLPLAALVPAQLQAMLAPLLRAWLPAPPAGAGQLDAMVIGIACCALLHELTRQHGVETVRSPGGRALLRCLAQLRALSNVVAGLQHVANAAARGPRPLPGPAAACGGLIGDRGSPALWSSAAPSCAAAVPAGGAWPLPGALARSGKGGAAPPKKPPPAPSRQASRATMKISLSPRRQHQLARPGRGVVAGVGATGAGDGGGIGGGYGTGASGAGAGQGSLGGAGAGPGETNKEVLFSVLPSNPPDSNGKLRTSDDRPSYGGRGRSAGSTHDAKRSPAAGKRPVPRVLPPAAPAPVVTDQSVLPSCVKFHVTREAIRQMQKARFDPAPLWFCVHDRARPLFNSVFDTVENPRSHGRYWTVSLPLHERHAPALRDALIRKYTGLGQLELQDARIASRLGADELFTVATLSHLGDRALRRHQVTPAQVLLPGCFKLVQQEQLDGRLRWLLAYAIPQRAGSAEGVRAGFMPITHGPEGFSLQDDESGLMFSSERLQGLIAGIERVSGWRHQHEVAVLPWMDALHTGSRSPGNPLSLFVRHPDRVTGRAGAAEQPMPFARQLRFFEPVRFGRDGRLLRSCYAVIDNMIVLVDAGGRLRTLVFSGQADDGDRRVLNAQRPDGGTFVQALGLETGLAYAMQDITGTLDHNGYTRMPGDQGHDHGLGARAGAAPLRILPGSSGPRLQPALGPAESGEIIAQPVLSSFHLSSGRLDYVDHDGGMGSLLLEPDATTPGGFCLAAGNAPQALAFARLNGLPRHACFTLPELERSLYRHGFVQIAESEGGIW